ncbi:uncharacterized protein LOC134727856 [Mytilus trossulus]|uniref:uncharacterized protein LOC134727856 n=1 Tax=Mytilus trossulus TaxID=6551 RepID=UPI003003B202
MAFEKVLYCGPCDFKHATNQAIKWCTDCIEALCSTCFDVHRSLKVSRNHNVITIEDHSALHAIMLDLVETQRCDQHDKASEYICPLHDEKVCVTCIQRKHSQCTGWLTISEAADGVKSLVANQTIKQDLENMIRNVEELIENHEKERIYTQNVCKTLKGEASIVVQSIIQKVQDLEAEFVKTGDVQHQEISDNIISRTTELKGKLQKVKMMKEKMNGIEGYASDTQIFLSIRKIATELIDSIEEVKSVTKEPLSFPKELQLTAPVQSFLSDVKLLCLVRKDNKYIAFQPSKLQKVQSHISSLFQKSIDDIEIHIIVTINVSNTESNGKDLWNALILLNGQLLFYWKASKHFITYTSDGEFFRSWHVDDKVKYMAIVDMHRIDFSYETNRNVGIFNMQTLQTEKKITFSEKCYGLTYDGNQLYTVGETTIFCVELTDNDERISSVPVNTSDVAYISVYRDRLYYADYTKHTIYCCYKNGEEIWSFKTVEMMFPVGITTDKYGNAYVTCSITNKVLVVSADGKQDKEILKAFDGLVVPRAIHYDKSENRLLVCNAKNGLAFLCILKL